MARTKFYLGRIVRRKHKTTGKPIGSYMEIQHVTDDVIYVSEIGKDVPNEMWLKDNVYLHNEYTIVISEAALFRLINGITTCIQHQVTPRWRAVNERQPEIIRFLSMERGWNAMFVVDRIYQTINLREPVIRIIIDHMICKKLTI